MLGLAVVAISAGGCAGRGTDARDLTPRRLTEHPAEDRSPRCSPDGQWVLFSSDRHGNWEIHAIRFDRTGLTRLTDNPGIDDSPAWAPSGDRFVFQSERSGVRGLWLAEWSPTVGPTEPELLLEDASPELVPDWSPDGRWIAFVSERDGNPELYRAEVASGRIERLTDDPFRDIWPRYFPDGKSLVFFSRRGTEGEHDDLYRLDLDDRTVARLTDHPTHHDFVPDVSPDGQWIVAAMSDRSAGRRELVVFDRKGQVQERLADGYHRVFHPVWSHDGSLIVYAARVRDGERADLFFTRAP